MDKISIFGSAGFIGSEFALLYENESIKINSGDFEPKSNKILYLRSLTTNYSEPEENVEINLTNLVKVLRNLKKNDLFVYAGSWFSYGVTGGRAHITKENEQGKVLGFYGASKLCAEQFVETYCKMNDIDFIILRLSNIIGIGDNFSSKKNALQQLIQLLKENKPIEIYDSGLFYRSYLDVFECVRAIKFIIDNGERNQKYNVGPESTDWNFRWIIDYCQNKLNSKSIISPREPSDFHKIVQIPSFRLDTNKLKKIGFTWNLTIEQSLDKILESLPE
jgi:nucleoside-diphosphate-sugar epimerase